MNFKLKINILFWVIFCAIVHTNATNYHVSTTGSSKGLGTISDPIHILKVNNLNILAGDTIFIHTGIYNNSSFGDGDVWKPIGTDVVLLVKDKIGTKENPIVFRPYMNDEVIFEYDGNGAIRIASSQHIKIEGFKTKGPNLRITLQDALNYQFKYKIEGSDEIFTRDPFASLTNPLAEFGAWTPVYYSSNAITLNGNSNHITISKNEIYESPGHAISVMNGADYVTINDNYMHDNGWYTPSGNHSISFKGVESSDQNDGYKIIIERNLIKNFWNYLISWSLIKTDPVSMHLDEGKGIHFQDFGGFNNGRVLVRNNVIWRTGNAGLTVNNAKRIDFINNTLVDCGHINKLIDAGLVDPKNTEWHATAGGVRIGGGEDIKLINNLIYISDMRLNALDATSDFISPNGFTSSNMFSGGFGFQLRATDSENQIIASGFTEVTDLHFKDYENGDFELNSNSPAINSGNSSYLYIVNNDYLNIQRSDNLIDVGAFEYFNNETTTGINYFRQNERFKFTINNCKLLVESISTEQFDFTIYNSIGKLVNSQIIKSGSSEFTLSQKGIYIIKSGNKTFKIKI